MLYGCNRCEIKDGRSFLNFVDKPALLCTECGYGLYMLTFDADKPADGEPSGENPFTLSMCLRKCEDFAHNYVSDPNTMRCEYCGPTCTQCSLQYGCSSCYGNRGKQHSDPRDYVKSLDDSGTVGIFPYRFNGRTKYGGPSSQFATCVDCAEYDERCDDCSATTFLPAKPAQKRRRLQGATKATTGAKISNPAPLPNNQNATSSNSTNQNTTATQDANSTDPGPVVAPVVPANRRCRSCYGYIEALTTQKAAGFCTLTSAFGSESSAAPNCLQPDPQDASVCLACENGFYLDGGACNACEGDYGTDTGCERCTATSCLECREGFNLKTVNGTGSCQPCNLKAERDKYSLFKHRANQCNADLTSVKYCSSSFLGSQNGDFPELLFLNETSSEPLTAANTCNMRCGTAQYPVVEFETINQNANMIKSGGTYCKECAIP